MTILYIILTKIIIKSAHFGETNPIDIALPRRAVSHRGRRFKATTTIAMRSTVMSAAQERHRGPISSNPYKQA
jgi:hypothetical protein